METSRYHEAEIIAQNRSGRKAFADSLAPRISDSLLPDATAILTSMPYLVIGALDEKGQPWASLVTGQNGFVSVDAGIINVQTKLREGDPLYYAMTHGGDIGLLTVNLAERVRYRVNGKILPRASNQFSILVNQCYRNCPQYMHSRVADYCAQSIPKFNWSVETPTRQLDQKSIDLISSADVFFFATHGSGESSDNPILGADVNHRGGNPGFVEISADRKYLTFPDYPGNYMFNSVGNLARFPRCGMLFIDFENGATLHVTGTATVDWEVERTRKIPGAQRVIDVRIDEVIWGAASVDLVWKSIQPAPDLKRYRSIENPSTQIDADVVEEVEGFKKMVVTSVVEEAENIRSIYLKPLDGNVISFKPGQHLKIHVRLPDTERASVRHYSFSDYDQDRNGYRWICPRISGHRLTLELMNPSCA